MLETLGISKTTINAIKKINYSKEIFISYFIDFYLCQSNMNIMDLIMYN